MNDAITTFWQVKKKRSRRNNRRGIISERFPRKMNRAALVATTKDSGVPVAPQSLPHLLRPHGGPIESSMITSRGGARQADASAVHACVAAPAHAVTVQHRNDLDRKSVV